MTFDNLKTRRGGVKHHFRQGQNRLSQPHSYQTGSNFMATFATPNVSNPTPDLVLAYQPTRLRRWAVGTLVYGPAGLVALFAWLLIGDFVLNMKERSTNPISLIVLRDFGASVWLVGLLVGSIPSAIGLLLGPFIGVVSDRHRGRWGRRIPFILLSAPVILITMTGLGLSRPIGDWVGTRFHLGPVASHVGTFALFWTVLEIATIISNSLFGALINDVVPQAVIGRFFGLFRLVGLLAGVIFNYWLVGKTEQHAQILFIGLGVLYSCGIVLMCLRVKEGQYPPVPPRDPSQRREILRPLIIYLKECYGDPFLLWFFFVTTLGGLTLAPVNTYAVYHAHSVNMSDDTYGKCVAMSYAISMVLAFPLGYLADRFHPLRVGMATAGFYAVATAWAFFFASSASAFFVALAMHTVVSGMYITATASLAQRLLPRQKFAEITSAGGILGAFIAMFVPPALGGFIEWMHHEYRYVFLLASILATLTMVSYAVLIRQFVARGGDNGYVAPHEGPPAA